MNNYGKYERIYRKRLKSILHTFCSELPDAKLKHGRVSQIVILEKGVHYIKKLEREGESLLAKLDKAKKRNQELLKKLNN